MALPNDNQPAGIIMLDHLDHPFRIVDFASTWCFLCFNNRLWFVRIFGW